MDDSDYMKQDEYGYFINASNYDSCRYLSELYGLPKHNRQSLISRLLNWFKRLIKHV